MSQDSVTQHWSNTAAMADFPHRLSWCISTALSLSLPFHCLKYNWIFSMPLSREHQDQRERHKVKDFQSPGWYAALRFWQIKITNWGRYHCFILHILTHGSRCVVSAWIPVGNYLSASAHWCHSFPVITQSPACQGQVTSRWAWTEPCRPSCPPSAGRHNISSYGLSVPLLKVMVAIYPLVPDHHN